MHDNIQEQVLVLQNDRIHMLSVKNHCFWSRTWSWARKQVVVVENGWKWVFVVGCLEIGYTQKQVVVVIVFVVVVVVTLSLMMLNMWPMGLKKPTPVPVKTPTLGCGWGFPWVRVGVALENPRVAHDNPYWSSYRYHWICQGWLIGKLTYEMGNGSLKGV